MTGAEGFTVQQDELAGFPVSITSYRIGDSYYCHVSNLDPGATVARAEAATPEAARRMAISKATERLAATARRLGANR